MGNEASQEGEDQGYGAVPGAGAGAGAGAGGQSAPSGFGPSSASGFGFGSMVQSVAPSGPVFSGGGSHGMQSLPSSAPASRRSSGASIRSMPPMGSSPVAQPPAAAAPEVDLSHLSEEERALIANVMARAQNLEMEPVHRLYKIVLRLHRGLPSELRILGDEYVREEFKRHKSVKQDEGQIFLNEWTNYAIQLAEQLGLQGPRSAKKIGTPLSDGQLDLFQHDQLGQLYELQQQASKTYGKSENNAIDKS